MAIPAALAPRLAHLALRAAIAGGIGVATTLAALAVGASAGEAAIFAGGVLLLAVLFSLLENAAIARAVDRERRQSHRDEPSELASGLVAEHFVAIEYAAAKRGRPVTLVVLGLDDLEAFGTAHGRAAAEQAVRDFAELLNRLTRRMNVSARYGWRSDVFVSVLSDADATGAEAFVQRVRSALAERGASQPMPTLSAGIAEMDAAIGSPEEFVERAEAALAEARAAGGACDRVIRRQVPPAGRRLQAL